MKRYNKGILLSGLVAGAILSPFALKAQTVKQDSLKREVVLEKEYVPAGSVVKKEFFNPLPQKPTKAALPVSFIKDAFSATTKYKRQELAPLRNMLQPDQYPQKGYIRLSGGYPLEYSAGVGIMQKTGENKISSLHLKHEGIGYEALHPEFDNRTDRKDHFTDLLARMQVPALGTFADISARLLYQKRSLYGLTDLKKEDGTAIDPTKTLVPPSQNIWGGALTLELQPKQMIYEDGWAIEGNGVASFLDKADIHRLPKGPEDIRAVELNVSAQAMLSYHFKETWSAGVKAFVQHYHTGGPSIHAIRENRFLFSGSPFIGLNNEQYGINLGVKIYNRESGISNLAFAPDVQLRYSFGEEAKFALRLKADGGALLPTLYEQLEENPYLNITSGLSGALNSTAYRILLGATYGSLNGFHVDVEGGFADHHALTEYGTFSHEYKNEGHVVNLQMVEANRRDKIKNIFLNGAVGYYSSYGFMFKAFGSFNHYILPNEKEHSILGLPTFTHGAIFSYNVKDRWLFRALYSSDMGVTFFSPRQSSSVPRQEVSLPMSLNIDLGITHTFNRRYSLGLEVNNLLNTSTARWIGTPRKGLTALMSFNINF
ncbi:MAG: hypothetical protein Q3998_01170 [Porphyromonas sp.]|nr:hypothetical protein [Porphyromonas sp.]